MAISCPPSSALVGPDHPRWTQTLSDGSSLLIRPIGVKDAEADRAFIEGLSAQSKRFRFLGQIASPSDAFIKQLTNIDYVNDVALVAVIQEAGKEKIIGVSQYAVDRAGHCECAVVVADEWQHKGLGTALMRHLIAVARDSGLLLMESTDLAENSEMRELARDLAFHCRPDPEDARQVIYSLRLTAAQ